jgi:hypothetical protein
MKIKCFGFVTMLLLATSAARADVLTDPAPLAPGQTLTAPNGESGNPVTLKTVGWTTYTFSDGTVAQVGEWVRNYSTTIINSSNSAAYPYGNTDLVFDYEIEVSSGTVTNLTVSGYTDPSTGNPIDVSVKTCTANCLGASTGGMPTSSISRSSDGSSITFSFTGLTGDSGALQVFTNASSYEDPTATLKDASGQVISFDLLGPSLTPAVPEPSTWAMMILGFFGVGFMAYRRTSKPTMYAA